MKTQILSLIFSVVIVATHPASAMRMEPEDGIVKKYSKPLLFDINSTQEVIARKQILSYRAEPWENPRYKLIDDEYSVAYRFSLEDRSFQLVHTISYFSLSKAILKSEGMSVGQYADELLKCPFEKLSTYYDNPSLFPYIQAPSPYLTFTKWPPNNNWPEHFRNNRDMALSRPGLLPMCFYSTFCVIPLDEMNHNDI